MVCITFLSDFGYKDHYVAAVKAGLLQRVPEARLIDISHGIDPFDIAQGAYVLSSVFRDFPEGSIHLVAVDETGSRQNRYLAVAMEGHYFIAADNGLLSLVSEFAPTEMVELPKPLPAESSFPSKRVFVDAASALANGTALSALGTPITQFRSLLNRQLKLQDHTISGNVVHIDHYGNLVTNISRDAIDAIGHGRRFNIKFGRESVDQIHRHYNQQEAGDCICVFNEQDLLEIAIVKGHAADLLGLYYDSQVDIFFYPSNLAE